MTLQEIKRFIVYVSMGVKALIVLWGAISQNLWIAVFWYFIAELVSVFLTKYFSDEEKDLTEEKQDEILSTQRQLNSNQRKLNRDFEKERKEQREYYAKQAEVRNSAVNLLNRLIHDGLIRGKDLLTLAGSADYYQLFVYSVSAGQLMRGMEEKDAPKRLYPTFLQELGFARLGKVSTSFLINKDTLKEKKLKDAREFKKFLDYHFSKIKAQEWAECLALWKEKHPDLYEKYKDKTHKEAGVFKITYLLTETNMNASNIGYVDGDNIGLAKVDENEKVYQQILKGFSSGDLKVKGDIKVKIKEIMEKVDLSFLLDEVKTEDKRTLCAGQDELKDHFGVNSVVGLYNVNRDELVEQVKAMGFQTRKARSLSDLIIANATTYHGSLEELGIKL